MDDAAKIALRVDSALWSLSNYRAPPSSTGNSSDPMEIGNVQGIDQSDEKKRRQRAIDIRNNACTKCHTKNCRPWKCSQKRKLNNVGSSSTRAEYLIPDHSDDESDEESEN